jgi:hypothetical protein
MEMFNFLNQTQYSAVNRTTNITNGAGATGANIFNDFTNLSITNNTRRPAIRMFWELTLASTVRRAIRALSSLP